MGLFAARIVLVGVFALAGAAKLADRAGTRRALGDFGVPDPLTTPFAVLLPLCEVATAMALAFGASARAGAAAALVLLVVFSAAIAANLARGERPDCRCFGQVHSTPIGSHTLLRNGVLAGVAVAVVAWGPGSGPGRIVGWLGDRSAAEAVGLAAGAVLFLLVALEGWFIVQLTRQQGRLLLRLDALEGLGDQPGLPLGSDAPSFSLPTLAGAPRTLSDLLAGGLPLLAVFTEPNCGPCRALLPEIGRWQADYAETLRVVVISGGDAALNRERARVHHLTDVLRGDQPTSDAYRINDTPAAVVIDPDGRVASPVATGADPIRRLVLRVTGAPSARQRSPGLVPPATARRIGRGVKQEKEAQPGPRNRPG
jgi:uncharacterized membrane protein YphA (DoxX/SURF4 family)/thiol-disulfide isomerase/thioredoxin